jgi:hypothetical protein
VNEYCIETMSVIQLLGDFDISSRARYVYKTTPSSNNTREREKCELSVELSFMVMLCASYEESKNAHIE